MHTHILSDAFHSLFSVYSILSAIPFELLTPPLLTLALLFSVAAYMAVYLMQDIIKDIYYLLS